MWVKSRVLPNLQHFSSKNAFYIKSTREIKLFLENCVLHYGELKTGFRQILPILAEKWVLHQIHSWNTNLFWKLCFLQVWVENSVLPTFHYVWRKIAFDIKSTRELKLFLENCVLRYGEFKTAFRKIFTNFRRKMGFASNPVMEYNSSLKTVFCAMVSWIQRFVTFLPILAEKWVLHQIHSWNTNLFWKLCFPKLWVENSVLPSFNNFSQKNAFDIKSSRELKLFLKNCVFRYC